MTEKIKKLPLVFIILDGWGLSKEIKGNAIALGKTPVMDKLKSSYPYTTLGAHGDDVGLPSGQDGNSEAGHMNIGAGRIIGQDSVYIAKSVSDGTFFNNHAFRKAIDHVKKNKSKLHIIGLLSTEESAHANPDHLIALLTLMHFKKANTFIHLFTDGRDSHQHAAIKLIKKLGFYIREKQKIASISGRFYAMDRKKVWSRTKSVYELLTEGKGIEFSDPVNAILSSYDKGESDEFIRPSVIVSKDKKGKVEPIGKIEDNDAVIFFNLRSDRARQLTKCFTQDNFSGFKRNKVLKNVFFVAMTDFGPDLPGMTTAFPTRELKGTLPVALKDFRQLYLAESEKYAHVTYFFNGGYDSPLVNEHWLNLASPLVDRYDEVPEMRVYDLAGKIVKSLDENKYDIIICNFANPDMVGHTGNLKAGIKAVESADKSVGLVLDKVLKKGGTLIVSADHGNVEEMIDLETSEIETAHTKNPVPFIIANKQLTNMKLRKGVLGDIAPTILDLLQVPKPEEMINKSLIIKK